MGNALCLPLYKENIMKLKQLVIGIICWSLITSFAQAATEEELLYLAEFYNRQVMILHQQGKYKEAVPVAEEVFGIRYSLLGIKHPDTLDSLNNLAMIYKAVGRLSKALLLYKECYYLTKQVLGPKHPNTVRSLNNLADTYVALPDIDKAINLLEQSIKTVELLRKDGNLSAENRQAIFKKWIPSYFSLSQLYIYKARLEDAFKTAEKTKARTLMESMTIKLAVQQSGLSTEEQQQIQQTQARIAFLNEKIAQESELDIRLNLEMQKNQLVEQAAEFHRSLMQKYPKYAQLNHIQIATAKTGASLIPEDALFISYLIGEENNVLVFTLDNTGKLQAYNLGKIPNLDKILKVYNKLLSGHKYVWRLSDGSFVVSKKPKDKSNRYLYLRC
jgi:putative ubiquitin-RnfH superfamily antitoxin RatB of RatAB toxin-antitoxin module